MVLYDPSESTEMSQQHECLSDQERLMTNYKQDVDQSMTQDTIRDV